MKKLIKRLESEKINRDSCRIENRDFLREKFGEMKESEALVNLVKTEYKGDGFDWK